MEEAKAKVPKRTLKAELRDIVTQMEKARKEGNWKEYELLGKQYMRLAKCKKRGVSPDAVFNGGLSLASMLLVMHYEELHVIATKAWGLLPRLLH